MQKKEATINVSLFFKDNCNYIDINNFERNLLKNLNKNNICSKINKKINTLFLNYILKEYSINLIIK